MSKAFVSSLLVSVVALAGCSSATPEPYEGPGELEAPTPGAEMRQPSEEELREQVTLAELVVVGRVLERRNAPEGENYTVDVQEVLSRRGERVVSEGDRVRVSAFFFRPGRPMARIGRIKEPERYLFFLSPMERDGWWLHLDDPAGYRLPEAEETLRALRARRPAPSKGEGS